MTLCSKTFARMNNRYVQFPELRLQGKWMEDSGFRSGHVVDVTYGEGKIIITIAKEQRFEGL